MSLVVMGLLLTVAMRNAYADTIFTTTDADTYASTPGSADSTPSIIAVPGAAGQPHEAKKSHDFTFRGHPYPETRLFTIMQFGAMGLASDERYYGADNTRLTMDLGLMANLGEHWALGGSFRLESTETDDATGLLIRGRRWLGPSSFDLSTGFLRHGDNGAPLETSWITQAQLNIRNLASLQVEMERWKLNGMDLDQNGQYTMLTESGTSWYAGGSVHYLPGILAFIGFGALVAATWD